MFFGDGGGVHDCGGGAVQGAGGDGVQYSGEASLHLHCGASKSLITLSIGDRTNCHEALKYCSIVISNGPFNT